MADDPSTPATAPEPRSAAREGAARVRSAARAGAADLAEAGGALAARVKPRLRGVIHQYAFFVSLVLGAGLVVAAPGGRATLAVAIYAAAVSALFGASALYHRRTWRPRAQRWMRRLDHSMIFVLIAGTYTPFGLLVLSGRTATLTLVLVWAGAVAGVLLKLLWIDSPRWLGVALYIAVGWVALVALPELAAAVGPWALTLLLLGGLLYTAGAVIYALRRPDPVPTVFGFHEVFHVLVTVAAALHYIVVAAVAVPGTG